ncbi:DUF3828 domain-containing protein [Chitinophaga sp. LS1]|uniref:DUF3828 domain-containing protein n=1 Tax=Chitinophaga sp. LS1 TaxID=3051176 RepID=UPI002AABB8CD|nr:DUF3828 domain-containing protein [Chitinophaga sp. LS1]WPV67746.1 DUF3828 domain-containing protein [Chitinophaga sp. LS1]
MKPKKILYLFILNTLLFIQFANAQTDSAKIMLTKFYKAYIPAVESSTGERQIEKLQKQYSTAKLISRVKKQTETMELDYDPYLNAQDADKDWVRTLQIEKDPKTPNLYNVSFLDNYEKKRHYIKVFVTKERNQYKISGFKN